MPDWLLKFGIAGVQETIAQSRKVRDLAAGSGLLSHVAQQAWQAALRQALDVELLLPAASGAGGRSSWPHQIVCRVRAAEAPAVRALGKAMWDGGQAAWRSALGARDDAAMQIVDAALETYWVAVSRQDGESEADWFRRAAARYDDRRNTRTFRQLPDSVGQRACTQCGLRPVSHRAGEKFDRVVVDEKEALCRVCVGKRNWSLHEKDFSYVPSTHGLAADRLWRHPESSLPPGISARAIQDWLDEPETRPSWLTQAVADVHSGLSPYYAIVACDGDRMGLIFDELGDADRSQASRRLLEFARGLREALRSLSGDRILHVYAGGDDALFLTPLDHLLPALLRTREEWRQVASAWPAGRPPTLTLHASVVHAKAPFQPALREVRSRLSRAKEDGGRDCVSILCCPRAGADSWMVGAWQELEPLLASVEAFSNWRGMDASMAPTLAELARRPAGLPARLLYTLEDALPAFFRQDGGLARTADLQRELDRCEERSGGSGTTEWLATRNWLAERAGGSPGQRFPDAPRDGWAGLRGALQATAFLARELQWTLTGGSTSR